MIKFDHKEFRFYVLINFVCHEQSKMNFKDWKRNFK